MHVNIISLYDPPWLTHSTPSENPMPSFMAPSDIITMFMTEQQQQQQPTGIAIASYRASNIEAKVYLGS